jgi:type I restriction enzyme S subunit
MVGEWKVCLLEDCMEAIIDYRGKTPRKTSQGIPLITAKVVKGGRIETPEEFIDPDDYDAWMRRGIPQPGDVVLTTEAPLGEVAQLGNDRVALAQRLITLRGKPGILDNGFLKFLMQSEAVQDQLRARASGTTVLGIKQSELRKILLTLPPIGEQRAIAHILGTLDDRIALNRRMNETLEAMARALFKSWFVDFDPVRAKAEGRDPSLPKEMADLFPDRFEDSELGEIPAGWRIGTVDEEFKLTMGQSPPGQTYNETGEGLPFYQGRADFGFRFPNRRVYCSAPTRIAEKGDTLVSVRAPVGDINMAAERSCIGRGVAAIRHKSSLRSYTYYTMRSFEEDFARFKAEGTVFGSISKKDFHSLACVVPDSEVVSNFERVVGSLDDKIELCEQETRTLASLRDTLLPKLISGELRVKDAERFLKERGLCGTTPKNITVGRSA